MGTEFVTGMYDSEAVANNVHLGYGGCHHARTLVADLDNLPRLGESDEEAYARNERVMLAAAAEVERLKPIVGRAVGETDEPPSVTLAAELHDSDIEWHAWPLRSPGGQHVGVSSGVLAFHRPTLIAAVSIDERSQMANKQAAMERVRQLVAANAGRVR